MSSGGGFLTVEHPVLWSEERRRIEERKIADESRKIAGLRRERQRRDSLVEQREYREMIEKHNPWGRKGGGAPNDTIRMTNILEKGLYPESFNDIRNYVAPVPLPKFRAGGGGAPLRTESGQIITTYRDDPQLSFNNPTKNVVDIELRYKTTPKMQKKYKMELDQIVEEKRIREQSASLQPISVEPWGRPGPGGSPWRPPKNIGCQFMQSMGWTDQKLLKMMDSETHSAFRNPYEKIPSPGNVKRIKEDARRPLKCCNVCNCCCYLRKQMNQPPAAPPPTAAGPPMTNLGKDSGGAQQPLPPPPPPQTTHVPRPRIRRECHNDHLTPKVTESRPPGPKNNASSKKQKDFRTRAYMISEGVELVPLLAKRRAQPRSTSLSTTDVTKYREPSWQDYGIQYLNDLCKQMKRKQYDTDNYKMNDVQSSQQHFDTWTSFWGRPGHGAPRDIKNKLNLDELLYKLPLK